MQAVPSRCRAKVSAAPDCPWDALGTVVGRNTDFTESNADFPRVSGILRFDGWCRSCEDNRL